MKENKLSRLYESFFLFYSFFLFFLLNHVKLNYLIGSKNTHNHVIIYIFIIRLTLIYNSYLHNRNKIDPTKERAKTCECQS